KQLEYVDVGNVESFADVRNLNFFPSRRLKFFVCDNRRSFCLLPAITRPQITRPQSGHARKTLAPLGSFDSTTDRQSDRPLKLTANVDLRFTFTFPQQL